MKALEDEPQLTLEACQGAAAAFEALVVFYEPRIRRMLYSLTQDVQLTQDLFASKAAQSSVIYHPYEESSREQEHVIQ